MLGFSLIYFLALSCSYQEIKYKHINDNFTKEAAAAVFWKK